LPRRAGERFLVTGALGCIGAWTTTLLAREGTGVVAFDLEGGSDHRLRELASPEEVEAVTRVAGDVTDLGALERALAEHEVTHVVHLAALQVPFCRADPPLGAHVNVVGTVNVFEAARRYGLATTLAYASSAAVYDRHGERMPETIYGVTKLANEGTAHIYAQDHGVASVGLRPFCVYGPARDQGVTAEPTHAMKAAARGEPYRISFGGRTELHFAPDVARGFIAAARSSPAGASTYDFPGLSVHIRDVVAAIEAAAPGSAGRVTFEDVALPFPEELPGPRFDAPVTPLADGVQATIEHFRQLAS
jgi:nucleoside-diphosphate-sugar epimerase